MNHPEWIQWTNQIPFPVFINGELDILCYSNCALSYIHYINLEMHSVKYNKIHITKSRSWQVSDPTCFGTKVPPAGSLLKQTNTIQHANPGTDRPHSRYQNIKMLKFQNTQMWQAEIHDTVTPKLLIVSLFRYKLSAVCVLPVACTQTSAWTCDPEGYRAAGAREVCRDGQCRALGVFYYVFWWRL